METEKQISGKFEWGTTITKAYLPVENTEFFAEWLNADGLAAPICAATCNRC